jgi:hypothetical protein
MEKLLKLLAMVVMEVFWGLKVVMVVMEVEGISYGGGVSWLWWWSGGLWWLKWWFKLVRVEEFVTVRERRETINWFL